MAASNQPPSGSRKSVTGFITKLVGDGGTFGFINDEIFFQQDVVVGGPVALNDRVFADCEYSENLPIKWNATSIKIIQRANASPGVAPPGAPSLLESDPRLRQGLLSQQQQQQPQQGSPLQQQPFNQPPAQPVANTYQQHRQQRQQQQQQQQQPPPVQQQQQQQQQQQPPQHMISPFDAPNQLDAMGHPQQPMVMGPEFFAQQPFVQPVSQAHEISPFQHDSPMGPPKITYTSQLGSAFVQGQAPMVPPPFLAQASAVPPPMLGNQQPMPQQQQRMDPRNKQGGRFNMHNNNNNQGVNKNVDNRMRDQDNRNRLNRNDGNRNDHQSRNQDRDSRSGQQQQNYSSAKSSDSSSRDRSGGRNSSPRRDKSNRSSPPSHHPIRSRTSVSSERSGNSHSNSKSSKRHYDPQNVPKSRILTNLNVWNMRSRCSSSIHVPSDLKDVFVNKYFRLDVKSTPKPIEYKIEAPISQPPLQPQATGDATANKESGEDQKVEINTQQQSTTTTTATTTTEVTAKENESSESTSDSVTDQIKREGSESSLITPPGSQPRSSDIKLNHKYGVKVILISLAELDNIYRKVFGNDLDSFSNESNRARPRLDEAIALLCNKGPNGGHSLIGGKFDPILDGFVEGEQNEFERYGRQPDLIATCRRVVLEQTGLDLGPCKSWTLLSTFVYNNKTDYFSPKASIEYSFHYLPQIWTMVPAKTSELTVEKETIGEVKLEMETESAPAIIEAAIKVESSSAEADQQQQAEVKPDEPMDASDIGADLQQQQQQAVSGSDETPVLAPVSAATVVSAANLADLKVVDLKVQLDERQIKYKPNAKKAELVALLHEALLAAADSTTTTTNNNSTAAELIETNAEAQAEPDAASAEVGAKDVSVSSADDKSDKPETTADSVEVPEQTTSHAELSEATALTTEGDTKTGSVVDQTVNEQNHEATSKAVSPTTAAKREAEDEETDLQPEAKKNNKKQRVELIKEPFVVRSREGQQQLAVVPLYDVVQVSRYDQFELSVASNLLREALVQHLSEHIFTTLVEDTKTKQQSGDLNGSLQDNSDTNSNNKTTNSTSKTLAGINALDSGGVTTSEPKDFPVNRYINLACAYFDSTHMGYLQADDLSKLFNNTGLTISKRALMSLLGGADNDKFNYRAQAELVAPTHVYSFPEQFGRLPGTQNGASGDETVAAAAAALKMVEFQGVKYDLVSLIEQVREFETARVNMVERFNHAIENYDKQAEEIHVLEVNQKSLTNAIKTQNDEISELKRERDSIKKGLDNMRKGVKSSVSSLNDLLAKDDK